jgi:hypothetical protein
MIFETSKALKNLLGEAEWSMSGDDLSTLVIHTEGAKAPTKTQLDAEIKKLSDLEAQKEIARKSLFERLGITPEEAKLLLE